MNEVKKLVDSPQTLASMLQAGEQYFVSKGTWTAEGVQKFMEQYEFSGWNQTQIKSIYLELIEDLSCISNVTAEVVRTYILAWSRCRPFKQTYSDNKNTQSMSAFI